MNRRTIWKTAAYFLLLLLSSMTAKAVEIRLKSNCRCKGPLVRLGDIAEIAADDPQQAAALAAIELFPAPTAAAPRVLRTQDVRRLLLLHGVDASRCRFRGAAATRVEAAGAAAGAAEADSRSKRQAEQADKRAGHPVVVAARVLARGQRIQTADVEMTTTDRPVAAAAVRLDEVVGQEAVRPLASGQIVNLRDLQAPLLVRRSDLVAVEARGAGLVVRTTARAVDNGALGDLVNVETLNTRERYAARVVGPRQVEVFVRGPIAVSTTAAARASQQTRERSQ